MKKATERAQNRTVGDPFSSDTEQGPQVTILYSELRHKATPSSRPSHSGTLCELPQDAIFLCRCPRSSLTRYSNNDTNNNSIPDQALGCQMTMESCVSCSSEWLPDSSRLKACLLFQIMSLIQSGKDQGATLQTGGGRHGDSGYYVQPTVFSDVQGGLLLSG